MRAAKTRLPISKRREMIARARVDDRPYSNKLPPLHPGVAKPSRQKKADTPMMASRADRTVRSFRAIIFPIHGPKKEYPVVSLSERIESKWPDHVSSLLRRWQWNSRRKKWHDIWDVLHNHQWKKRQICRLHSEIKRKKKRSNITLVGLLVKCAFIFILSARVDVYSLLWCDDAFFSLLHAGLILIWGPKNVHRNDEEKQSTLL